MKELFVGYAIIAAIFVFFVACIRFKMFALVVAAITLFAFVTFAAYSIGSDILKDKNETWRGSIEDLLP